MSNIKTSCCSLSRETRALRKIHIAVAVLGSALCCYSATAAESGPGETRVLRVPASGSRPKIDGKLDEPCWKEALGTGPLEVTRREPAKSTTEAFVFRDGDHLYVGVACGSSGGADAAQPARSAQPTKPAQPVQPLPISKQEHVALLIDSNHDRNSYYLIVLTREGTVEASYNEHWPPWHDPTWSRRKPRFQSATALTQHGWIAEFALPLEIFDKNKTLTSEIGLKIRRHDAHSGQTHCLGGDFSDPSGAVLLSGIPARGNFAVPPLSKYAGTCRNDDGFRPPFNIFPDAAPAGEEDRPIRLGPGSTHPDSTGEVRIELESFLLGGNVHARALIWDLAVDERKGELYVLSAPRRKNAIELRVFDRAGKYLRTIMPFNPTLPGESVRDLCRRSVTEGAAKLVVPKLFEPIGVETSLYGDYWHLPQSMAIAPNGDLIMSNIFKRTLWRMRPDGSLPAEGWTSIHNPRRNEPFESAGWLIGPWKAKGLKPYLSYGKFCLPDFCFDEEGDLYVSGGVWSPLSAFYSLNWEVPGRGQGEAVRKYRLLQGTGLESVADFAAGVEGQAGTDDAHFNQPCGLAFDGTYLIVADSGNNRLQVLDEDGRLAASITSFKQDGRDVPLGSPTALAIDHQRHLYVLALLESERRLIKLESWREPRLLAVSEPLDANTVRIALDGGLDPPLVWVANGAGRGTLLQLAGDNLSLKGNWAGDEKKLSSPFQYGYVPILNIDPQTGDLYVEDDSYFHRGLFGKVYRLNQDGEILKKWPPMLFTDVEDWDGELIYHQCHNLPPVRYAEEPLFIDSFFGKDGRIYRWRRVGDGEPVRGKEGRYAVGKEKPPEILRFDRAGNPIPFEASGSNALVVDQSPAKGPPRNSYVYRGMDVDAAGNIYYVNSRFGVDVYDSDGNPRKPGLVQLTDTRGLVVDRDGSLYVLACPRGPEQTEEGHWTSHPLYLSKFAAGGGKPIWSRPWEGILGCGAGRSPGQWTGSTCICLTPRVHQALDGKGYLYVAGKFSVGVIDCETGGLVGEFGSYGNMDCIGKSGPYPHPELPLGTISALAVWQDRLYVVDALNARIAKCRIIYDPTRRKVRTRARTISRFSSEF